MALRATKAQVKAMQRTLQHTLDGTVEEVKAKTPRNNEEAMHQAAFFAEAGYRLSDYPQLRWMFATLNGIYLPPQQLAKAIDAGLTRGILDIWIPLRRVDPDGNVWSGLAMDMKVLKGGSASTEQKEWAEHLVANGWRAYFPQGCIDAWRCLCCYEGIGGRDHWAEGLIQREESIRRICGV